VRSTQTSRRLLHRGVGVGAVLALSLGLVPSAVADPQTPPSQQDIQAARTAENLAAASVAQLEVELARLSVVSDQAMVDVQVAAEDYLTASDQLATSEAQATQAQERAASAQTDLEAARQELTAIALEAYRSGGSMGMLEAVLSADGYQDVVERTVAYQQFGSRADAAVQRFDASRIVADALTRRAGVAVAARQAAKVQADAALQKAQQTQARAARQVADAATQRTVLIGVLAARHHTTAALESQRQDAVDAERRRRADAAARAARATEPPVQTPAPTSSTPAPKPTTTTPDPPATTPNPPTTTTPNPPTTTTPNPPTTTTPDPPAATTTPDPPAATTPDPPASSDPYGLGTGTSLSSASQGQAAANWAKTKTGLPYGLGKSGPDAYDCSGLTSSAWATQGIAISRTSRTQYKQVKKISYNDLRPGDLVFWATNTGNADSIYHVAIWIGGGQIVEATVPGVTSRVTSMRWSGTMPFAGRA